MESQTSIMNEKCELLRVEFGDSAYDEDTYRPKCKSNTTYLFFDVVTDDFKFCPFCGKEVEVNG